MISIAEQSKDFVVQEVYVNFSVLGKVQFLRPDSSRVAMLLQSSSGGAINVSPVQADQTNFLGFQLNTGQNPIWFYFKDWGALLTGTWFADSTTLNAQLYCLEVFYRPQVAEDYVIVPRPDQ